ncbi:MAG: exonuclease SbcCD subunit D [Burkholderiaceae bacterium]
MLRLIHTADWQIGREFGQFEADDAAALAAARVEVVSRIVKYAASVEAKLIVVAGDVFDAPTIGDKLIRRVFDALNQYEGHWILLPGNHDPALAAGVWVRAGAIGCVGPRTLVASEPGIINIDTLRTSVLVAPLTQRSTLADTTDPFDQLVTPDGYFRVGVAHGSVSGLLPGETDAGNPISADRAVSARLDYLALGDWHGQKKINEQCWYSGTPEPDRFRANEPGYVLDVALSSPGAMPKVVPIPVSRFRWHDIRVTLNDQHDLESLDKQLASLTSDDVVRLHIDGTLTLAQHQQVDDMIDKAAAKTRGLRQERSGLNLTISNDDFSSFEIDGYLAQVLDDLQSDKTDLPDAVRQEALRLFSQALSSRTQSAA